MKSFARGLLSVCAWVLIACACLVMLANCGGRRLVTDMPGGGNTPYVRLATYNAVIAEANLALAKSVRTAAEVLAESSQALEVF